MEWTLGKTEKFVNWNVGNGVLQVLQAKIESPR